jgi:hypothetical protein
MTAPTFTFLIGTRFGGNEKVRAHLKRLEQGKPWREE